MKVVFLDIDGVLNCEAAYEQGFCKYETFKPVYGTKGHYQTFYPPAKENINKLIEATDAKIVISSTWRKTGINWCKDIWQQEQMKGEIIDITPVLYLHNGYSAVRGMEIRDWLRSRGFYHCSWSEEEQEKSKIKSGIKNYLIIDDDSDMLYEQKDNFVCVHPSPRNKEGFNKKCLELSLKILQK